MLDLQRALRVLLWQWQWQCRGAGGSPIGCAVSRFSQQSPLPCIFSVSERSAARAWNSNRKHALACKRKKLGVVFSFLPLLHNIMTQFEK